MARATYDAVLSNWQAGSGCSFVRPTTPFSGCVTRGASQAVVLNWHRTLTATSPGTMAAAAMAQSPPAMATSPMKQNTSEGTY